jgi:hypothetical protein
MRKVVVIFVDSFNNLEAQCALIHSYGARITKFLPKFLFSRSTGVAITASPEVIQKIEQHPSVKMIEPDEWVGYTRDGV